MSSNLTISYTSQTAAGSAPSGAPAADAPAANGPLGFLAALIDQLLAGGVEAVAKIAATETGADVAVPGLLNLALDTKTAIAATPDGADLLVSLTGQLDALKSQIDAGTPPTPDQLKTLSDTVSELAAALSAPKTAEAKETVQSDNPAAQLLASLGAALPSTAKPAPTAEAITDLRDRLLTLGQSVAATSPALSQQLTALAGKLSASQPEPQLLDPHNEDTPTIAQIIRALLGEAPVAPVAPDDTKAPDAAPPATNNELPQILASLGISTPIAGAAVTASTTASTTTNTDVAVPPALVRLSTQLAKLSTELAQAAPELAQKLDAVATTLISADADPKLFAQLTSAASDPDGTALDKLVQSLIDAKPVTAPPPAAPQIAATAELPIPAPLAPKQSKSAVTEVKAAPPSPTPVTADSAPEPAAVKIAVVEVTAKAVEPDLAPKVEAKIVADVVKTDASAGPPTAQQAAAPPPVPANQVRTLPAAYQPAANPINMGQVAFEMVRQVHQGTSRFTIRLDPPEMGRVDVRMHVDQSGTVNARLTVDRAETLDMFQRDQRSLERALAQAGLDSSKTNLEFSLRQNPFAGTTGGDHRQQHQNFGNGARFSLAQSDEQAALPAVTLYRGTASAGGVNIFA